ncbi:hypothetical protein G6M89_12140 [Natronolimnobius sp. AArcel1]|uniref:hypothetical protein n=1 Tax=Natronolimnobius sp. AArcel1 TaxID=1679093 RepID=UPI0013EB13C6|nr:hypothetical protein [Natronolimnobius sp. AArcel1]NGM69749.1 hypothetical protein [Natronolimnobius sp. AArcel1]
MHRRGILAAAMAVAVAGCSSDEDDSAAHEGEADAEIVATDLLEGETSGTGWGRIEVENPTAAPHGRLEIDASILDEDGDILAEATHISAYIPPETTLRWYVRATAENDRLEGGDIIAEITEATTQPERTRLDDATVHATDLSVGGDVVNVVGELDVPSTDKQRVTVIALIYDVDGRLRGTGTDILYDPEPGTAVEFSANSNGFRAPAESPSIESYDVFAFGEHG